MSNKEKETYATKKELAEAYQELKSLIGESSSTQTKATPNPEEGSDKMPLLKCKGKDCGYQTESVEDYVEHRVHEVLNDVKPEAKTEPATEPKRHKSVDDFLNCPECFPKFEEAFIKRGYTKPAEKKPEEKKKKRGLF